MPDENNPSDEELGEIVITRPRNDDRGSHVDFNYLTLTWGLFSLQDYNPFTFFNPQQASPPSGDTQPPIVITAPPNIPAACLVFMDDVLNRMDDLVSMVLSNDNIRQALEGAEADGTITGIEQAQIFLTYMQEQSAGNLGDVFTGVLALNDFMQSNQSMTQQCSTYFDFY